MTEGKVLHAIGDNQQVVKFVGHIRYTMSQELSSFLQGLLAPERPAKVILDLTEAEEIDSTGLGLLARFARRAADVDAPRATIVCADHDMNLILSSIGLESVFDFTRELPRPVGDFREVLSTGGADAQTAETVLEAHRSLMELSVKNRETFAKVVEMLEKDIETKRDTS